MYQDILEPDSCPCRLQCRRRVPSSRFRLVPDDSTWWLPARLVCNANPVCAWNPKPLSSMLSAKSPIYGRVLYVCDPCNLLFHCMNCIHARASGLFSRACSLSNIRVLPSIMYLQPFCLVPLVFQGTLEHSIFRFGSWKVVCVVEGCSKRVHSGTCTRSFLEFMQVFVYLLVRNCQNCRSVAERDDGCNTVIWQWALLLTATMCLQSTALMTNYFAQDATHKILFKICFCC